MMREGSGVGFALPPGTVLGSEWAGEIVELGVGVEGFQVGDRVMGTGRGAFGEFKAADAHQIFRVPDSLDFSKAASLPTALTTMHNAVITVGQLKPGQSVLVQGASAGVGLMAMLIARYFGAGLVIGTSNDRERCERLAEFGADISLDSRDPEWVQRVLEATGGAGIDLVIDQVSGIVANQNLAATRVCGRIVNVGRLGGETGLFDFDLHAARRIDYVGVTFRTRSRDEIRDIFNAVRADLWPAIEAGKLNLPISQIFPFTEIEDAIAVMEQNRHFGKIVLTM
jgi:NADPH2:quinone reductase